MRLLQLDAAALYLFALTADGDRAAGRFLARAARSPGACRRARRSSTRPCAPGIATTSPPPRPP
ncbi:MAG: hypothetical protein U0802_21195 [Candidatus Binatia bacterium]